MDHRGGEHADRSGLGQSNLASSHGPTVGGDSRQLRRLWAVPSHPELLDKLATRLVELDWNTDALIREIVLSRTWGLSNDHQSDAHAKDPENKLYWRSTPRRLPAESIRDSMLMASGELVSSRPEGSPISFAPGSARLGQLQTQLSGPDHHRSVYLPSLRGTS